jgi:hypothetical protein
MVQELPIDSSSKKGTFHVEFFGVFLGSPRGRKDVEETGSEGRDFLFIVIYGARSNARQGQTGKQSEAEFLREKIPERTPSRQVCKYSHTFPQVTQMFRLML